MREHWIRCWTWPIGWARRKSRRRGPARALVAGSRVCRWSRSPAPRPRTRRCPPSRCGVDPAAADLLEPADILVDGMRGPSSIWYRIRINLQHVPEDQRPPQEPLLADYNPWENYSGPQWMRRG